MPLTGLENVGKLNCLLSHFQQYFGWVDAMSHSISYIRSKNKPKPINIFHLNKCMVQNEIFKLEIILTISAPGKTV